MGWVRFEIMDQVGLPAMAFYAHEGHLTFSPSAYFAAEARRSTSAEGLVERLLNPLWRQGGPRRVGSRVFEVAIANRDVERTWKLYPRQGGQARRLLVYDGSSDRVVEEVSLAVDPHDGNA